MLIDYQLGQTGIIVRLKIKSSTSGNGLTGQANNTAGLNIGTIADSEAASTAYTSAGSTIDTIATLGTYAAPTANHCRFREVDATNHPGLYEVQLANARFAAGGAKSLVITITGLSGALDCDVTIPLRSVNPYDAIRGGMTALPNVNAATAGGLPTLGTGAGQFNVDGSGNVFATSTGGALGTSASQTSILNAVNAITTNTARGKSAVPSFMARPTSSSTNFELDVWVYSLQGQAEDPDTNTINVHARDATGASLDGHLAATTMTRVAAAHYKVTYTVQSTDNTGEVFFDFSWTVSSVAFGLTDVTMVEDAESLSTLNNINTIVQKLQFDAVSNYVKADVYQWNNVNVGGMPNSTTPPSTGAIASAVMTDVSDTVGADVVAIKAQTEQLTFSGGNLANLAMASNGWDAIDIDGVNAR